MTEFNPHDPINASICNETGFEIISSPAWENMIFGENYRISIKLIGGRILYSKVSGVPGPLSILDALAFSDQLVEAHFKGRPYVKVEDLSDIGMMGQVARNRYIQFLKQRPQIAALIFCSTTPFYSLSIKLGKRLSGVLMPVRIVPSYRDAVIAAESFVPMEKPPPDQYVVQSSEQSSVCRVSGLRIVSLPHWQNLPLGPQSAVSFSMIGDRILSVKWIGSPDVSGLEEFYRLQDIVLNEVLPAEEPYLKIIDYQHFSTFISYSERQRVYQKVKEHAHRLIGFVAFNASVTIAMNIRVGWRLFRLPFPARVVKNFNEAVLEALQMLDRAGFQQVANHTDVFTQPEWSRTTQLFSSRIEILNQSTVHWAVSGRITEDELPPVFTALKQAIYSLKRIDGGSDMLIGIGRLEGIDAHSQKKISLFLEELKAEALFNQLVFYGKRRRSKQKLFGFEKKEDATFYAKHLMDGLRIIRLHKKNRKPVADPPPQPNTRPTKKYVNDLLDFIARINWDHESSVTENISYVPDQPFSPVYDALLLLKLDLDALFHERENALKNLQASEERYRQLIDNANDIIFSTDLNGRLTFVNRAAIEILGYSHGELLSMNILDLQDRDDPTDISSELTRRGKPGSGPFFIVEMKCRNKNGLPVWLEVNTRQVLRDGAIIAIHGIARDVSQYKTTAHALKISEERSKRILETIEDGYYEVDLSGSMTYMNPAFCRVVGFSEEELIGMNSRDIIDPSYTKQVFEIFNQVFVTKEPVKEFEWKVRKKNGRMIFVEASVSLIDGLNGNPVGFRGIIRDVSERKRVEADLSMAKESAEAASEAKGRFLAHMSHEIRTPMNGVIGMTRLLMETPLMPEQQEFAETIRLSSDSLLSIINDILDFSKMEAGQLTLEYVAFDLRRVVDDVMGVMAAQLSEKQLGFSCVVHRDVPDQLKGDPGRLKQILINLLNNAVKFTDKGRVKVAISLTRKMPGGADLRFEVSDTGIGIPPERRGALFQPFTQIDSSLDRRYGGTGLGLAICSQLAELMGGAIGIRDNHLRGSVFWFSVQLGLADQTPSELAIPGLDQSEIFLIADDDSLNDSLSELLIFWGAEEKKIFRRKRSGGVVDSGQLSGIIIMDVSDLVAGEIREIRNAWLKSGRGKQLILLTGFGFADTPATEAKGLNCLNRPIRSHRLRRLISDACGVSLSLQASATDLPATSPESIKILNSLSVLMAEDNPVNQRLGKKMLEKSGSIVHVVGNGKDAVTALGENDYDVVLMDVQMPIMDGLKATSLIRSGASGESKKQVPIIALTAHAMKGDQDRCIEAGMNGYLAKPIRFELLADTICSVLSGSAG